MKLRHKLTLISALAIAFYASVGLKHGNWSPAVLALGALTAGIFVFIFTLPQPEPNNSHIKKAAWATAKSNPPARPSEIIGQIIAAPFALAGLLFAIAVGIATAVLPLVLLAWLIRHF